MNTEDLPRLRFGDAEAMVHNGVDVRVFPIVLDGERRGRFVVATEFAREPDPWGMLEIGKRVTKGAVRKGDALQALWAGLGPAHDFALAPIIRDDAIDAAKWRALIGCARLRVMGYAGNIRPGDVHSQAPAGHVHMGVEFWSHHPEPTDAPQRELFEHFVAHLQAAVQS